MKLKLGPGWPILPGMRAGPIAPFEPDSAQLACVALALNHPVVALESLPGGPAEAAITVQASGAAALVLRSPRVGGVVWLDTSGADPARAFERALARAESLGFLFEQESYQPGAGLERAGWPGWLRDVFEEAEAAPEAVPATAPSPPTHQRDLSGWLSKFRWALGEEV